jgi:hypothetical protein
MDFLHNPIANEKMNEFCIDDLEPEALDYLKAVGATQKLPIERLEHMNQPAIDIYKEHNIDLYSEPLEIAVCAQHNNGGFAINKWWQSNIKHTFVIGEMAASHGVKRPGGSALNAGQVGAQRAAEFIVNVYGSDVIGDINIDNEIETVIGSINAINNTNAKLTPAIAIEQIQKTMTAFGAHIRKLEDAKKGIKEAIGLFNDINKNGFTLNDKKDFIQAIQASHLSLTSIASLKAIIELLTAGSGSRGSHLVLSDDGVEIHPDIKDSATGQALKFKPENQELRKTIIRIMFDPAGEDLFKCESVPLRTAPTDRKAFEPAWSDYRKGTIYHDLER